MVLVWAEQVGSVREAFAYEKQAQGWGRAKREALFAAISTQCGDSSRRRPAE